jgi:hypothetical protein
MSPTARALAQLRKDGWLAEVVERFIPGARVRRDLFGFIDIVAMHHAHVGLLGIQVTTTGHMADRLAKMTAPPIRDRLQLWFTVVGPVHIWGYAKRGPRGQRKTWQLTRRVVTLRDLTGPLPGEAAP